MPYSSFSIRILGSLILLEKRGACQYVKGAEIALANTGVISFEQNKKNISYFILSNQREILYISIYLIESAAFKSATVPIFVILIE